MRSKIRMAALVGLVVIAAVALGSCTMVLGFIFPNQFTFQGAELEADRMYILNFGPNGAGGYEVGVWLTTSGLTIDNNGFFAGSGSYAYIELTLATNQLQEGEFVWNPLGSFVNNTIYWGGVELNWSSSSGGNRYYLTGGSASVRKTILGDEWVIEWEGSTSVGTVKARYRGAETAYHDLSGVTSVNGRAGALQRTE